MHSSLTTTLLRAAFPREFEAELDRVLLTLDPSLHDPHMAGAACLNVGDQIVIVPQRFYFAPANPHSLVDLTPVQRVIRAAIMTRNISGYERESGAMILLRHRVPWGVPFLALLLGDYVIEIHDTLSNDADAVEAWKPWCQSFAAQNPAFRTILSQRIVSYWDAYYRQQISHLSMFPAFKLANHWGLWDADVGSQILRKRMKMKSRQQNG